MSGALAVDGSGALTVGGSCFVTSAIGLASSTTAGGVDSFDRTSVTASAGCASGRVDCCAGNSATGSASWTSGVDESCDFPHPTNRTTAIVVISKYFILLLTFEFRFL